MALLSTKTGLPSFSAQDNAIVNYFTDGGFERGSNGVIPSGWVQYNDGAVAVPVDGTGGAAVAQVTMLCTTSSPIRGTLSAVISKDANNRQGVGYSFPFTISNADKGITAGVNFELVTSANYVSGDMVFYIYDVTNSTLITPRSVSLPALPSYGKFFSDYGLTAGTSYRFILHIATTSALAYTVTLDTMVNTTTRVAVPGSIVGEWLSYTPTVSAGFGTASSVQFYWRRVGSSMQVSGYFVCGTVAGSLGSIPLPTGYTLNTSAFPGNRGPTFGRAVRLVSVSTNINDNTGAGQEASVTYDSTVGTSAVLLTARTSGYVYNQMNVNSWLANSDAITVEFIVPIAEWAGSGSNFGPGASLEYAADDGTSDVFGPNGAAIPTITLGTGTTPRAFTFIYPPQSSDFFVLELQLSGVTTQSWIPADTRFPWVRSGLNDYYGMTFEHGASNLFTVYFGNRGTEASAGFGSNGSPWTNAARYRLRKANPSAPVGQVLASTDGREGLYKAGQAPGIISGVTVAAGYIGETIEQGNNTFFTTSIANIFTQTLQPGKWRIAAYTSVNTGAGPTGFVWGISTTSVTFDTNNYMFGALNTTTGLGCATNEIIVNVSTATTYYILGQSTGATISSYQRNRLICQRIG
jgi:hypothetical protein